MSGFISELFGYRSIDQSNEALSQAKKQICPFLGTQCTKILSRTKTVSGVCSIKQVKSPEGVICCPNRLYANDYEMLRVVSKSAFNKSLNLYSGRMAVKKAIVEKGAVAVFGHGWGGELRLPKRQGTGSYFVDWVLARLNNKGELEEFTAIEVQTIDTTGNYQTARTALINNRELVPDTVGLNWENVSKRIIPQIIYKGQVLQREDLCKTGLFFVCPSAVYENVLKRLGGKEKLAKFPPQPASIHFIAYDYDQGEELVDGRVRSLKLIEEHCTTVYKVQEAFSAVDLPEGNVYRDAIIRSLYGEE